MVAKVTTDQYPRFWTIGCSFTRHLRTRQVATSREHVRTTCCIFNTQHRSTLPISGPCISLRGPISSPKHLTIEMLCLQHTTPIDTASFPAQVTIFRLLIWSPHHIMIDMLCLQPTTPIYGASFEAHSPLSGCRFRARIISRSTTRVFNTQHRSTLPISSHKSLLSGCQFRAHTISGFTRSVLTHTTHPIGVLCLWRNKSNLSVLFNRMSPEHLPLS